MIKYWFLDLTQVCELDSHSCLVLLHIPRFWEILSHLLFSLTACFTLWVILYSFTFLSPLAIRLYVQCAQFTSALKIMKQNLRIFSHNNKPKIFHHGLLCQFLPDLTNYWCLPWVSHGSPSGCLNFPTHWILYYVHFPRTS